MELCKSKVELENIARLETYPQTPSSRPRLREQPDPPRDLSAFSGVNPDQRADCGECRFYAVSGTTSHSLRLGSRASPATVREWSGDPGRLGATRSLFVWALDERTILSRGKVTGVRQRTGQHLENVRPAQN